MAKRKKTTKKVVKKTGSVVENKKSFDTVKATVHVYGKQARELLEERGCSKCKEGKEKFVYTSTYIRGQRVFIEVVCVTCKTVSKVLMPGICIEDI